MHMASPLSNTLFARAIGHSGAEFPHAGSILPALAQAQTINDDWATRAFGSDKLFYIRQLPADEVLEAALAHPPAPRFGPIVDGYFIPDTPDHIYAEGKQAHIPLLAGWVSDEAHLAPPPTADQFLAQLRDDFGAHAKDALAVYPIATDAQLARSANDFAGDRAAGYATWAWLEAHSRTGDAPVYRYFFDLPNPGDRNHSASLGAFHSDDIEYTFGALDSRPEMAIRPEDRALWTSSSSTGSTSPAPATPTAPAFRSGPRTTTR